jgi:hypothetical protein
MPAAVRSEKTPVKNESDVFLAFVIGYFYCPPFAVRRGEIRRSRILIFVCHFFTPV